MIKRKLRFLIISPFLLLIFIYQRFISVLIPPSCIYWPSCSEYSKQAFQKHGPFWGVILTAKRLSRCHPFREGGIDEVPETLHFIKADKNG